MVFRGHALVHCVLPRSAAGPAAATAIAFHAIHRAVATHARMVMAGVVHGCTLDTAIAADHAVIAVLPAIRTAVSPGAAIRVGLCSGRVLDPAIAAN